MSKKTPMVILKGHQEYDTFASGFDALEERKEKVMSRLAKEAASKMTKLSTEKQALWKTVTDKLLEDGIIDSSDVALSYSEGVMYMEPANSSEEEISLPGGLDIIFRQMFRQ